MNVLFLVYLIAEVIFGMGFLLIPGLMMSPMGVTLDETSTTFARLFGSLIISIPVLLFFVRKSASKEFRRAVVYYAFTYLLLSTIILLITQLKGLMNPLGWGIVMIHFIFMIWFGYYLINQSKMDSSR
jgi:hypothetical protein